jgi:4-amino-4-deoxy-L-arabinose transferase-like glycosyltransferase
LSSSPPTHPGDLRRDLFLVAAAGVLAFVPFLGQTRRLASNEIRHAEIAREMAESGDFLIPRLLGRPYLNKPPVLHAAAALLFRAAGRPSLGLARAPSVAAGILGALLLYGIGRTLADRRTALLAAILVLGVPGYGRMAREVHPDMIYAAGILLSCFALGRDMKAASDRPVWPVLAGFGSGLATLAKGPLGLLFPLLFLLLAPSGRPDLRRPRAGVWLLFLASSAATLALWAIPVRLRDGGEYLHGVLTQPDLGEDLQESKHGLLWYLPPLFASFLPFSLFLPLAAVRTAGRRAFTPLAIGGAMLLVLSIVPKKRSHYLLPIYPFLSLGVAEAVVGCARRRWIPRVAGALAAASLAGNSVYLGLLMPLFHPQEADNVALAREVVERVEPGRPLIVSRGMAELLAFVGRRNRVWEAPGPEDLLERIREGGVGTYLVLPEERSGAILRALEGRVALSPVLAKDLASTRKGRRWDVLRVDSIRP